MDEKLRQQLIQELKNPEFIKLYGKELARTDFALTLCRAREKAGVTQKDLSAKLGLSQPYIAKLESGKANPTLGKVGAILAILGFRLVTSLAPLVPEEDKAVHPETDAGSSVSTRAGRKPVYSTTR